MKQINLFDGILVNYRYANKHINAKTLRGIVLIVTAVLKYADKARRTIWNAAEVRGLELYVITIPLAILTALWVK